jgi:uncharacterized membrane protein YbhN (UPF0104 family)
MDSKKPESNMKKCIKLLVRIAVSVILMIFLLSKTGIGNVLQMFGQVAPEYWALAAACFLTSQFISAARWRKIAHELDFSGSYPRFARIYFTGMFFNLFMPTSIGGDLLKAVFLGNSAGNRIRAGYSIIMDRVSGMTGLFILGSVMAIMFMDMVPKALALTIVLTTLAGIASLFVMARYGNGLKRLFPRYSEKIDVIMQIWHRPRVMMSAIALSVMVQAFNILAIVIIGDAMNINVEAVYYYIMFPAVAILSILPVSISGIGVRESSMAYLLAIKNVPEDQAVALSLAWFAMQAIVCLSGGIIYITGWHKR